MSRETRRLSNIKQKVISNVDFYPSSTSVREGEILISNPRGKPLRLYKKLKGMLWWSDFTKDGNEYVDKNLEVKGAITTSGTLDYNNGTMDLSTQTVDVTLNSAVDALNFDSNTLSIDASGNKVGIGTAAPAVKLNIDGGSDAQEGTANTGYLIIGSASGQHIAMDNNEIMSKSDGTTGATLYINAGDSTSHPGGNLILNVHGGAVGIGTASPSSSADLTLEGGVIALKETLTPAANTNYGKIYTKSDNKLYFQAGNNTEYEISLEAL